MTLSEDFSTWRVLVVDDEPDNLELVGDFLSFSGATVLRADNGQQALELFQAEQPNIVLLDLAMPDMDGWEVHRRLRAQLDGHPVPVVALTALAMPGDAKRVQDEGFDAYITKPFRISGLRNALIACVQRHLANRQHVPAADSADTKETTDSS
jgi:two-component system, cell cycle response regulator DivK